MHSEYAGKGTKRGTRCQLLLSSFDLILFFFYHEAWGIFNMHK